MQGRQAENSADGLFLTWSIVVNVLSESDRCVRVQAMIDPSWTLPATSWLAGLLPFDAQRPAFNVAEVSVGRTHAHELEAASIPGQQALMSLSCCSRHPSAMQVGVLRETMIDQLPDSLQPHHRHFVLGTKLIALLGS